jgi:plastocyanin
VTAGTAIALVAGAAMWFVSTAGAQGGGTVEVEVKYSGAPVVEKLKVNKGLAYAVASAPGAKGATKTKAVIDQHGCKFVPHVVAMPPGEIEIKNSDGILHNIHTYSTANPSINKAQPKFKKTMTEKFEKPEVIKVTCDVHSWMLGWVAVTPGIAAVTDKDGVAKLENVPAGKQKIEVWHETLGKQEKDVDVKAGATTKVSFEMKGK